MPYIEVRDRHEIDGGGRGAETAGELNYQITRLLVRYARHHGLSYQTCNDIVGALDNAKDEFRRRVQHPYEDQKIATNGDIEFYREGSA